jgi:hypothetical protein
VTIRNWLKVVKRKADNLTLLFTTWSLLIYGSIITKKIMIFLNIKDKIMKRFNNSYISGTPNIRLKMLSSINRKGIIGKYLRTA